MNRRDWLATAVAMLACSSTARGASAEFAVVVPDRLLRFPEDEGSHPDFRTEWWYVTGWLDDAMGPLGFQVTFFRTRPHPDRGNPSRFSPQHIILVHAAVSERAHGRLRTAQRVARAGFGLAEAQIGRTDVHVDHWHLRAREAGYVAHIDTDDWTLDLRLDSTQMPLLQGRNGYSRKGPRPASASYYYSLPHLAAVGSIRLGKITRRLRGQAWLDHEWSSEYLDAEAIGWDWAGINLDDGAALMAFRMRGRDGTQHWAAATLRSADQRVRSFAADEVHWLPIRHWRSPRTGAAYPVAVQIGLGDMTIDLVPLMEDQENDTRATTGAVYWEGAVSAMRDGHRIGRGYLELTGYAAALKM